MEAVSLVNLDTYKVDFNEYFLLKRYRFQFFNFFVKKTYFVKKVPTCIFFKKIYNNYLFKRRNDGF
jgi:hypothetical protein